MKGYLVVLERPERSLPNNPKYRGLDRLPPQPALLRQEAEALDAYVFGKYKDANGLIPSEERARELRDLFAVSPRSFEIICVETVDDESSPPRRTLLGYDVAGETPFESAVGNWPGQLFAECRVRLNEFGLFQSADEAKEFFHQFRRMYPDEQPGLMVWRVWAVGEVGG